NGHLYTATNGSSAGGNTPGTPIDKVPHRIDEDRSGTYSGPMVLALKGVPQVQPDLLLKLEQGAYYGHPNPIRGEYVLNGGNPTAGAEPYEVKEYPIGTMPQGNWDPAVFDMGVHESPDGAIEYHGGAFAGALDHQILVCRYSGGG